MPSKETSKQTFGCEVIAMDQYSLLEADFANSKILLDDQKHESNKDKNCTRDSMQRGSRQGNKTIAIRSSSRSATRSDATKTGLQSNFQDISRVKGESSDFNFS